jgi:hypothetical protein
MSDFHGSQYAPEIKSKIITTSANVFALFLLSSLVSLINRHALWPFVLLGTHLERSIRTTTLVEPTEPLCDSSLSRLTALTMYACLDPFPRQLVIASDIQGLDIMRNMLKGVEGLSTADVWYVRKPCFSFR